MSKFFPKGTNLVPPKSSGLDDQDFDAKHTQDIQAIKYNNRKLFHKALPLVTLFLIIFLLLLFFIILPIPEIPLRNEREGHILRYYFVALRNTGTTAFITFLAIIGSEFLKQLYKYLKNYSDL